VPNAIGDTTITITYDKATGLPAASNEISLVPGSRVITNGAPTVGLLVGSPITWGCVTGVDPAASNITNMYPYLPANCRF